MNCWILSVEAIVKRDIDQFLIIIKWEMEKLFLSHFFINFASMKRIVASLILILSFLPIIAQKKEINTAIDNLKANKDLDKVEASMTSLLKDSSNTRNEKIWELLFESLKKQYQAGNEKLYLKQKFDTASLFNIASRMFTLMTRYDSIEATPDKKGKVKLKMRKQNSNTLNSLRPNLFNGGIYFIGKQNYSQAYTFLDQYVSAAEMPIFKSYNYSVKDNNLPKAAYWAAYCGYKLNDPQKVLRNTYLALKDKEHLESMMQYLASTYMLENDTTRSIETMEEGFTLYPKSEYFFSHLMEYYSKNSNWDKATVMTDKAIKADSTNMRAWIAKGTILINSGDYENSYQISQSILKKDSTFEDAWLNAGLARYNQGVKIEHDSRDLKQKRKQILQYYKEALPYLEKYRNLCPNNADKWAMPLYSIYLNLNMGKQFDEIDEIIKKLKGS